MRTRSIILLCVLLLAIASFTVLKLATGISPDSVSKKAVAANRTSPEQRNTIETAEISDEEADIEEVEMVFEEAPIILSGSPEQQLRQLLAMKPTEAVFAKLTEVIGELEINDWPKSLELFEETPPGAILFHALSRYFERWAETDPVAALNHAFKPQMDSEFKIAAAADAAKTFAERDYDGALAYLNRTQLPEHQMRLIHYFTPGFVKADAARTQDWIKTLPETEQQQSAMFLALQQLTETNVDTAVAWVSSMLNEPFLQSSMVGVCLMIAESDPSRAVEFLKYIPNQQSQDQAVQSVFSGWYLINPNAAEKYCAAMPSGREKEVATQSIKQMKTAFQTHP